MFTLESFISMFLLLTLNELGEYVQKKDDTCVTPKKGKNIKRLDDLSNNINESRVIYI